MVSACFRLTPCGFFLLLAEAGPEPAPPPCCALELELLALELSISFGLMGCLGVGGKTGFDSISISKSLNKFVITYQSKLKNHNFVYFFESKLYGSIHVLTIFTSGAKLFDIEVRFLSF